MNEPVGVLLDMSFQCVAGTSKIVSPDVFINYPLVNIGGPPRPPLVYETISHEGWQDHHHYLRKRLTP